MMRGSVTFQVWTSFTVQGDLEVPTALLTKENPLVSLEAASAACVRGAKAAPRKTSYLPIYLSLALLGLGAGLDHELF